MSATHLFVDCDTAYDLAALDLLDYLCPLLIGSKGDIYTLEVREEQVRNIARLSTPAKQRAMAFFRSTGNAWCQTEEGHLFRDDLVDLDGMDAEALLYACAAEESDSCMVTGDRHSIRTLNGIVDDQRVQKLKGRILLTETVLLRIHQAHGWEVLEKAFRFAAEEGNDLCKFPIAGKEQIFLNKLSTNALMSCEYSSLIKLL